MQKQQFTGLKNKTKMTSNKQGQPKINLQILKEADVSSIASSLPPGIKFVYAVDSAGNTTMGLVQDETHISMQSVDHLQQVRATKSLAPKLLKILKEDEIATEVGALILQLKIKANDINPRPGCQANLAALYRKMVTIRENMTKVENLIPSTENDFLVLKFLKEQHGSAVKYMKGRMAYYLCRSIPESKESDQMLRHGMVSSVFSKLSGNLDIQPGSKIPDLIFPKTLSRNLPIAVKEFKQPEIQDQIRSLNPIMFPLYEKLIDTDQLVIDSLGREPNKSEIEKLMNIRVPLIRQDLSDLYGTRQDFSIGKEGEPGFNIKLGIKRVINYVTGILPFGENPVNWHKHFLGADLDPKFNIGPQVRDFVTTNLLENPTEVWPGLTCYPDGTNKNMSQTYTTILDLKPIKEINFEKEGYKPVSTDQIPGFEDSSRILKEMTKTADVKKSPRKKPLKKLRKIFKKKKSNSSNKEAEVKTASTKTAETGETPATEDDHEEPTPVIPSDEEEEEAFEEEEELGTYYDNGSDDESYDSSEIFLGSKMIKDIKLFFRSTEGEELLEVVRTKILRQSDKETKEEASGSKYSDAKYPLGKPAVTFFKNILSELPEELRTSVRVRQELARAKQTLGRMPKRIQQHAYSAMLATLQQIDALDCDILSAIGEDEETDSSSDDEIY